MAEREMKNRLEKRALRIILAGVALALATLCGLPAQAQTVTQIYAFKGTPDGTAPWSTLIRDSAGNLYGTTQMGGNSENEGTAFELTPSGNETALHVFTGYPADANGPYSGLAADNQGNAYGTTFEGGSGCYSYGCGAVYKINAKREESLLYSFTGGLDGGFPHGSVTLDAQGNVYGMTVNGGTGCPFLGCGVVYKITSSGQESVVFSFTGLNGAFPYGSVILDSAGNIYGTTTDGGAQNAGVAFMLNSAGDETILHTFTGGADGAEPTGGLLRDAQGNLYGTTATGGDLKCNAPSGCGVVFKLDTSGNETVLHTFTGAPDGAIPGYGSLLNYNDGNLVGTTSQGGSPYCNAPEGCGVVFAINPASGKFAILHRFTGLDDGGVPYGGVIRDPAGNLYGTTYQGGDFTCNSVLGYGCGVVFELSPK